MSRLQNSAGRHGGRPSRLMMRWFGRIPGGSGSVPTGSIRFLQSAQMKQAIKWLAVLIFCAGAAIGEASVGYRFDGPRNAQVEVDESATQYNLEIKLIPVVLFDPATNEKLTRAKSRTFALLALARHLKVPPTSELFISGLQISEIHEDGPLGITQASLPKSGIKVVPCAERISAQPNAASLDTALNDKSEVSRLLTRAGDVLDSVGCLRKICREQIAELSSREFTDEAVADLEQSILDKFAALGREIAGDNLLLSLEREEVQQKIDGVVAGLIEQLRQVVNMRLVSSMNAEAPYAAVLKADPLLLQVGGARIIHMPGSNQTMILSVASTAVRDNSASDRVRMQKVCRTKALAELLSQQKGLQVKYALHAEDQAIVVFENGKESVASLETTLETTSAQVEGFVQALPVVGTWYSAAGDMFFLAIGKNTEQSKQR